MIKMYLLSALGFIFSVSVINAADDCTPPSLPNGYVSGEGTGDRYVGRFSCNKGFTLVGDRVIKCQAGRWTATLPICTSIGKCDPSTIPHVAHGHNLKVRKFRGSVYKVKCSRGFHRYGSALIHCAGDSWNVNSLPVCAKAGCDGAEMEHIDLGRVRRLAGGAVYRFQCDPGAAMAGSKLVYCDGTKWNDTKPTCHVAPSHVTISGSSVVSVDSSSVYSCVTAASTPAADIAWTVTDRDGNIIEDSVEVLEEDVSLHGKGWITTSSIIFSTSKPHASVVFKCTATNKELGRTVSAKKHVSMQYGPEKVTVLGPSKIVLGASLKIECESSPSVPPSILSWKVESSGLALEVPEPETSVVLQKDGSEVTRSSLDFPVTASHGHALVVTCAATNKVLGNDKRAYVHKVNILRPPSMPVISGLPAGSGVPSGSTHQLICSTRGGIPPATLHWYHGQTRLESVSEVAGDLVEARLNYVPRHNEDTELTCEANNEALSQPLTKTILIAKVDVVLKPSAQPLLGENAMADDASNEVNPNDDYDYSHFEYVNKYFETQFEKQEYEVEEDENYSENKIDVSEYSNDADDKGYTYIEEDISKTLEDNFIDNDDSDSPVRSENTGSDTVHNLNSPDRPASDVSVSREKQKYNNQNIFSSQTGSAHSYKVSFPILFTFALVTRTLLAL